MFQSEPAAERLSATRKTTLGTQTFFFFFSPWFKCKAVLMLFPFFRIIQENRCDGLGMDDRQLVGTLHLSFTPSRNYLLCGGFVFYDNIVFCFWVCLVEGWCTCCLHQSK